MLTGILGVLGALALIGTFLLGAVGLGWRPFLAVLGLIITWEVIYQSST